MVRDRRGRRKGKDAEEVGFPAKHTLWAQAKEGCDCHREMEGYQIIRYRKRVPGAAIS